MNCVNKVYKELAISLDILEMGRIIRKIDWINYVFARDGAFYCDHVIDLLEA